MSKLKHAFSPEVVIEVFASSHGCGDVQHSTELHIAFVSDGMISIFGKKSGRSG